jgi:hypothetical protein
MAYGDKGIETGWLIEVTPKLYEVLISAGCHFDSCPIWWNGIDGTLATTENPEWTNDSNIAIRMARKEDAERVIKGWGYSPENPWFIVTSHEWA